MQRSLTDIKRQLAASPDDSETFAALACRLNAMKSTEISPADINHFKAFKTPILEAIKRFSAELVFEMLEKIFDETKADKKRIDNKASALTAVFWAGQPNYRAGRLKNVYAETQLVRAIVKRNINDLAAALATKSARADAVIEATLTWLLKAQASAVTDEIAKKIKPFKKQLFAALAWPSDKRKIFDEAKPDKKNLTTALGKVFCQGNSSVDKPRSQLGSIYQECKTLGLLRKVESDVYQTSVGCVTAPDGAPSLFVAAAGGKDEVAELLLEEGAAVDQLRTDGATPLYIAAYNGHVSVARLLLANDANPNLPTIDGMTPLMVAAFAGCKEMIKLLLAWGASASQTKNSGETALYFAAQEGQLEAAQELVTNIQAKMNQADINRVCANGSTSLIIAAQNGDVEMLVLLIKNGADVNQALPNGATSLYVAASRGYVNVVELLLQHHAAIHKACEGWTPLNIAAKRGHDSIVNCLLQATLIWLLQAQAHEVTDEIAKQLKPYHQQLFNAIKVLQDDNLKKQAAAKIFDVSKSDKKNLTTALGKLFCQGDASIYAPQSLLGSIYKECVTLGLVKIPDKLNLSFGLFAGLDNKTQALKEEKAAAPDKEIEREVDVNPTFDFISDNQL